MSAFQMPGTRAPKPTKVPEAQQPLPVAPQPVPGVQQQPAPAPAPQMPAGGSSGDRASAPAPAPANSQVDQTLLKSIASQQAMSGVPSRSGAANPPPVPAVGPAAESRAPAPPPSPAQSPDTRVPGAIAGAPSPGAPDPAEGQQDQMWNDIMSQWKGETGNYDAIANESESRAGRRVAAMNAAAGHGMGGGFAGGMGQASLTGQSKRMDLEREHSTRGLELQMTHLQDQLKMAEAAKDRQQAHDIQDQITAGMMELERIRQGAGPNADGEKAPGSVVDVDVQKAAQDPKARADAQNLYNSSSQQQKNEQAKAAFEQAPVEIRAGLTGAYADATDPENARLYGQRWAYEQFLASGSWPNIQQINQAVYDGYTGPTHGTDAGAWKGEKGEV